MERRWKENSKRRTEDGREKQRKETKGERPRERDQGTQIENRKRIFEDEVQRASKQYLFHQFDTGCKWPRVEKKFNRMIAKVLNGENSLDSHRTP